ncbi:MAG: TSUP family transporter [Pseudomonadales bacterium]
MPPMWIPALIVVSVVATSTLSGLLGMAGGMILMAILLAVISVPATMTLHGAVQATANGSRAWFLRKHIAWAVLPPYLIGAMIAVALFSWLLITPSEGLILIVIGIFPWLARVMPSLKGLDVLKPVTAAVCGLVVTSAQLFAGASGPLLDVFYLNSKLDRFGVIASKALTQAIGHVLKLVYWGGIIGVSDTLSPTLIVVAMAAAVVGTRLGTWLLARWNQAGFRRWSGAVILTIATLCLVRGVTLLWASA